MLPRVAVVLFAATAGAVALGACSYTKKDDAPIPSRVTNLTVSTAERPSVVGTLPPVSPPPTTVATSPPTETPTAPTEPATDPPVTSKPAPPKTTPKPTNATAAPGTAEPGTAAPAAGPVTVQAGAFSTADAANQAVAALAAKGFGGFSVSGSGPFRVVRGGLSGAAANSLVRSLANAGVSAFIRG
jgi:cell division protein FtsN